MSSSLIRRTHLVNMQAMGPRSQLEASVINSKEK